MEQYVVFDNILDESVYRFSQDLGPNITLPLQGISNGQVGSVNSSLSGSSMTGDMSKYYKPTNGDESFKVCSNLTNTDITKALVAAHPTIDVTIPTTCSNGTPSKCDEAFINDMLTNSKRLQAEIDGLVCQVQNKLGEKSKFDSSYASCLKKLDGINSTCNENIPDTKSTCTGCKCSTKKKVKTVACGCKSIPKKKKVCKKPKKTKKKRCGLKKKNPSILEEAIIDEYIDDLEDDVSPQIVYFE